MFDLEKSQQQMITFVIVDPMGVEVEGLLGTFTLQLSKAGGPLTPSTGTKAEIGGGWYSYLLTAAETDTAGPLSIRVTSEGTLQQNLEYVVTDRRPWAIEFTYSLTNDTTSLPIGGATVWFTTDDDGAHIVWSGETDAFGVARDRTGRKPRLDPGQYFIWRQASGYLFADDPDIEIVG